MVSYAPGLEEQRPGWCNIIISHIDDVEVKLNTIEERYSIGARTLLILLAINIPLAAIKLVAGIVSGSSALVSSSIITTMTALTTVSTITEMRLATRPADKRKFFMQSRLGVIFTRLVATALVIFGIVLVRGNIVNLLTGDYGRPSWIAIPVCVLSVILKEYAYIITRSSAAKTHNSAVMTEAIYQRIDMGASAIALLGATLGMLLFPVIDPLFGVVIAAALSWMGLQLWWNSIVELLEEKLEPQLIGSIKRVLAGFNGSTGKITLKQATTKKYGGFVYVDVVVGMDPSISLYASHEAADRIEDMIKRALPFVSGVDVQAEPAEGHGGSEDLGADAAIFEQEKHDGSSEVS